MQLFCEVGIYEDAVALALTFDRQLAVAIARRPEGDDALSRKLWLAIARHIVEQPAGAEGSDEGGAAAQGARVREVSALLEESRGALRIEDVLPLFPDFVEIDAFKDAVCRRALGPYSCALWPANCEGGACRRASLASRASHCPACLPSSSQLVGKVQRGDCRTEARDAGGHHHGAGHPREPGAPGAACRRVGRG